MLPAQASKRGPSPHAKSRKRHKQQGSKPTQPRERLLKGKGPLDKLIEAFQHLSEPNQGIVIIGILLLLFLLFIWLATHPDALHAIFKVLQFWLTAKSTLSYLHK